MPSVINDEFGYWISAASFGGKDWSSSAQGVFYYSYGYGIILSLILRVFNNYEIIYKAAIALNAIWLLCSFELLYSLAKILFPKKRKDFTSLICLVVALYSSNICLANYTLPEVFLFFLFCLITWALVKLLKTDRLSYSILFSIVSVYSFMVHQRMLAVLVAGGIIVCYAFLKKKLKVYNFLCVVLITLILLLISFCVKDWILFNAWGNSEITNGNDFEGQYDKIKELFTMDGILNFGANFIGKFYYLTVSTCGIAFSFIFSTADNFINQIRRKRKINLISLFLFLSIMFELAISAIFLSKPDHTTHLLYGRYIENLYGPILLIGIYELYRLRNKFSFYCFYFSINLGVALFLTNHIQNSGMPVENYAINSIGLSWIYSNNFNLFIPVLIGLAVVVAISNIKKHRFIKVNVLVIILVYWVICGEESYNSFKSRYYDTLTNSVMQVKEIIDYYEDIQDKEIIIYTMDDNSGVFCAGIPIQFVFPDKKVYYLQDAGDVSGIEEEDLLFTTGNIRDLKGMKRISVGGLYSLWVYPQNPNIERLTIFVENEIFS